MGKNVGFIGLGHMGKYMAENLLKNGFNVTVYDIRAEAVGELKKKGAKGAACLKELGAASDIVFVMVLNYKQVESVVLGEKGVISGMNPGSTLIITSTIAPTEIKIIADYARERNVKIGRAHV